MKSFDNDLKKYAEKTRLKAAEHRELRERVFSYMEYHPLPKQQEQEVFYGIPTEPFVVFSFNTLYTRIAAGVFAIVLIVGIPLVAEFAVPGDVLYLVKTEVNEGIRSQMADSPYEKVVLETKFIERRISEARLLASKGELTEKVQAEIAETVKGHANAAQSGIAEMRENDVDAAAIAGIALSSALEVQSAVLNTNQDTETASSSTAIILEVVNTAHEEVVAKQESTAPSFDALIAQVELETTRALELLESVKNSATPEEQTDITRRLDDIDRAIIAAKDLHAQTGATVDTGIPELTTVLGSIQKVIVFMTDIDVRQTVALDTLVPVTLTPEERVNIGRTTLNNITTTLAQIEVRIPDITDADLLAKVELGKNTINDLLTNATTSLDAGEIDAVEPKLKEAAVLVLDLDRMTMVAEPVTETVETPVTTETVEVPEGATSTESTTTPAETVETTEGQ